MELLDDIKIIKQKKPIFSLMSILVTGMFTFMMCYIGNTLERNERIENEIAKAIFSISLLIVGVLCSLISFVRKEKPLVLRIITIFLIIAVVVALYMGY